VNQPRKLVFGKIACFDEFHVSKVPLEYAVEIGSGDEEANIRIGNPEFCGQNIVLKLNRFFGFSVGPLKKLGPILCDELDEVRPEHLPPSFAFG
jgi:hypothetical protein